MPTKYTLDGLLNNILHGQTYDAGVAGAPRVDGKTVAIDFFSLNQRSKWADFAIVLAFAIAVRIMHWVVLRRHYNSAGTN